MANPGRQPDQIRAHSHRYSIFWQFLQEVKPGDGELGFLLRSLRSRVDMPRHFPHRTALINYMLKCRIDSGIAARNALHVYNLYSLFYHRIVHPRDDSTIGAVNPKLLTRSGVTRHQLALAILEGLGIFDDPSQHLAEGGKWADSALGAADSVIALLIAGAGQ